jgi:5'-3' exoribonuclease 2
MGVPSFFAWWASYNPAKILHTTLPWTRDVVLYLDFNGAIHPAVRTDPTLEYDDMPAAVCEYLNKLIENIKPSEVYVAIDGVAPVAKMSQQRERRFKSAKESKHKRELAIDCHEPVRDTTIDFNMISPATEFMSVLETYIQGEITESTKPKGKWAGIKFTLSGSCIPGEGEHKIMDEIRLRRSEGKRQHNCIYGLDADLLFLSLLNDPDCVLVRENVRFRLRDELGFDPELYPYIYLDVHELRNSVCHLLDPLCHLEDLNRMGFKYRKSVVETIRLGQIRDKFHDPDRDRDRLIRDYVFVCFLMGNDFLPRLPCLKIRNGSLNDIIVMYKLIGWKLGDYLIKEDLTVNRTFFYHLLGAISCLEDDLMMDMNEKRQKDISRFKFRLRGKTRYEKSIEEFDYVENQYKDTIMGGTRDWRKRYYEYHIGLKYRNGKEFQRQLRPMCQSYIEGMNWVMQYYIGWHNNWSWHYSYDAAPTALDLFNSLSDLDLDYEFEDDFPVEPYVQLLSILPPESAKLLPATLRPLMSDRDSPIHYMYPLKITLSLIGNKFWHECKPRMPLVDHQLLKDVVHAKVPYMSAYDLDRNTIKEPLIFRAE